MLCAWDICPIFKVSELPKEASTGPWDPKLSGWSPPRVLITVPHTSREKNTAHCAETKRLNHTCRHMPLFRQGWKAHSESTCPIRDTTYKYLLLSISLQAKMLGACFTVPSGCTDQRPETIKALQLRYCWSLFDSYRYRYSFTSTPLCLL